MENVWGHQGSFSFADYLANSKFYFFLVKNVNLNTPKSQNLLLSLQQGGAPLLIHRLNFYAWVQELVPNDKRIKLIQIILKLTFYYAGDFLEGRVHPLAGTQLWCTESSVCLWQISQGIRCKNSGNECSSLLDLFQWPPCSFFL